MLWCGGSESEERARIEDELEIPVIHEALQTTEEGLLNCLFIKRDNLVRGE